MSDRVSLARNYLIQFMRENFTDKSFSTYIEYKLAGDFACEIAVLIERMRKNNAKLINQCRDHDTRRAAAVAQAAALAAEVERLNETITRLLAEGADVGQLSRGRRKRGVVVV